jgi:hypothetical protein
MLHKLMQFTMAKTFLIVSLPKDAISLNEEKISWDTSRCFPLR